MNLFESFLVDTNVAPIPSTFNEGFSHYETVSKLIYVVNEMIKQVNENTEEEISLKKEYESVLKELNAIKQAFDKYTKGDFIPNGSVDFSKLSSNVLSEIDEYIREYMYNMHNVVSFGLENGHFVAYIPRTWKDINFETDPNGRLVLEF